MRRYNKYVVDHAYRKSYINWGDVYMLVSMLYKIIFFYIKQNQKNY